MADKGESTEEMKAKSGTLDDLCEAMTSTASVHGADGIYTAPKHPRFAAAYKDRDKRTYEERQLMRRQQALERQKEARFDAQMRARAIALNENMEDFMSLSDRENDDEVAEMDTSTTRDRRLTGRRVLHDTDKRPYANQLMFSEWLVHIPSVADFESDWMMLPCPVGKRCLVVAAKGVTIAYDKTGRKFGEVFSSQLPGGSKRDKGRGYYTLLDCIWDSSKANGEHSVFYILDCMCWQQQSLYNCDFDFRHFWLNSQYASREEQLQTVSGLNRYPFHRLPTCACTKEAMTEMMASLEGAPYRLDGLLFYHVNAHYEPGVTPLVGWLKPFMMPELLGVNVPEVFRSENESPAHVYIAAFELQPRRQWEKNVLFKEIDKSKEESSIAQ